MYLEWSGVPVDVRVNDADAEMTVVWLVPIAFELLQSCWIWKWVGFKRMLCDKAFRSGYRYSIPKLSGKGPTRSYNTRLSFWYWRPVYKRECTAACPARSMIYPSDLTPTLSVRENISLVLSFFLSFYFSSNCGQDKVRSICPSFWPPSLPPLSIALFTEVSHNNFTKCRFLFFSYYNENNLDWVYLVSILINLFPFCTGIKDHIVFSLN